MNRVLLVSTVHEEKGLATASALLDILEAVRPEVIFLEIPPELFPAYDEGTRCNLESIAASRYREATDAMLIPVDLPTPEESFFRDWQYMDRRITATSPAYRQLIDQHTYNVERDGFSYLNSAQCRDAWSAIYDSMKAAIQRLSHDTSLPAIYETWRSTISRRDGTMLQNIDAHFSRKPFTIGVLLVGSAHANSIVNRSCKDRHAGAPQFEWWNCDENLVNP